MKHKTESHFSVLLPLLCILCAALLALLLPTDAEAQIYDDTVRLHILADSDDTADQILKLRVRDYIIGTYSPLLAAASPVDAKRQIRGLLPDMERDLNRMLREWGSDLNASVSLSEEWYDTRTYGERTVPAGTYTSLRIILGSGKGQNWWCVVYPPLCLDTALGSAVGFSEAEESLLTSGYTVRFRLVELASSFFRDFSRNR